MSYQIFMSIWGGFAIFIAAGLLLMWMQHTLRKTRRLDPSQPDAVETLIRYGIRRLEVRQIKVDATKGFTREEALDKPAGTVSLEATEERVLVLTGYGKSRLFDYEIHRCAWTGEKQAWLEDFARKFEVERAEKA